MPPPSSATATLPSTLRTPTGPAATITQEERDLMTQHGLEAGASNALTLTRPELWRESSAYKGSRSELLNQFRTRSGELKSIDDAYAAFYAKVTPKPIDMGLYRKEMPLGDYAAEQQTALQLLRDYLLAKPKGFGRDAEAFWALYKSVKYFDPSPDERGSLQDWEAKQPQVRREAILTLASVDFEYKWKDDTWDGVKMLTAGFVDQFTEEEESVFMGRTAADLNEQCTSLVETIAKMRGAGDTPPGMAGATSAATPIGNTIPQNPGIARQMLAKLKALLASAFAKVKKWVISKASEFKLDVLSVVKMFTALAEKVADLAFGYAIPLIGEARALFESLWNTAQAVVDSLNFSAARRAVVSATGTCVEIVRALQSNLNGEIASNAFETMLSAGALAGEILSAGTIGKIVSFAIDGVKWLARTLYRICKIRSVRSLQKEIRAVFGSSPNMSTTATMTEAQLRSLADSRAPDGEIDRRVAPALGSAVPFKQAGYAESSIVLNQLGGYTHLIKAVCTTTPFLAAVLFGTELLGAHPSHVFHGAVSLTARDVSDAQALLKQCEEQSRSVLQGCGFVVKFKRPVAGGGMSDDEIAMVERRMKSVESLTRA